MAVSGSSDFTRTRDQIIRRAFRVISVVKSGDTPGAQIVTDAAEALNAMVKRWQKKGLHVWTVTEATLFPQASQVRYALASGSADHATESYVATELTASASSGATSITVDAITGISSGDNIGTVLDDGSIHWTTVNGAPAGSNVTLTTGLDDSASDGAAVFTYTTKIVRPLKIVDARRFNIASQLETTISETQGSLMARLDYQALPNKAQTGTINRAFYDPQRDTGYLYLWQPPSIVTDLVKFTWHRPIMDFDNASDNPDLPQEWFDALVYNLAISLCDEFDVPLEKQQSVALKAASYLEDVQGDDREGESLYMQADMGY
jgi:hypothetical protein